MPCKRASVEKTGVPCHPDHEECNTQLMNARMKFSEKGEIYPFVPNTRKNNLWKSLIANQLTGEDKSQVVTNVKDYSGNFEIEREMEVMTHSLHYMITLYCLNYRELENRLRLVDRMNWGELLGIPFEIVKKWWSLCRKMEIQCQVECPTILGYLEPLMIFKKTGRVPSASDRENLRLNNGYMEGLLKLREDQAPLHDFKPKCLSRIADIKTTSTRLARKLECELFDGSLPAAGRYRWYCPNTGLPVSLYIQVCVDGVMSYYWQQVYTNLAASRVPFKFELNRLEIHMFCDRKPPGPKTSLSDSSSKQGKQDSANSDAIHGHRHTAEMSRHAQPHGDRLDARERAAEMDGIDVDALIRHQEERDSQLQRGREKKLYGFVDLDFRTDAEEGGPSRRSKH